MEDYGRRLVIDLSFDRTLAKAVQALHDEGLDVVNRFDVRDYVLRKLHHDFRRYVLLQALPSRLMLDALRQDLDVGTILPATVAIYELADGETAVVASEPFGPVLSDHAWRQAAPELATVADQESEQVARALRRLQRSAPRQESAVSGGLAGFTRFSGFSSSQGSKEPRERREP